MEDLNAAFEEQSGSDLDALFDEQNGGASTTGESNPDAAQYFEDLFKDIGRGMGRGVARIAQDFANEYLSANAEFNKLIGQGDGAYEPVDIKNQAAEIFPDNGSTAGKIAEFAPDLALAMTGFGAGEGLADASVSLLPKVESFLSKEQVLSRLSNWSLKTLAGSIGSQAATGQVPDAKQTAVDYALGALFNRTGKVLNIGYRALKGTPDAEMKELVDLAVKHDVPLMTSDVRAPKTAIGKLSQSYVEKIPFAGTGGMRAKQQEARQLILDKVMKSNIEPSDEEIYQSLVRRKDKIQQAAGNRYKSIEKQMGNDVLDTSDVISTLESVINDFDKKGLLKDKASISALEEFWDAFTDAPQTYSLLKENRTNFRKFIQGDRPVLMDNTDRLIKKVESSMTDALHEAVRKKLGDQTLAKYKQANAIYAAERSKIKNTRLKNIFEKGDLVPDKATAAFFSNSPGEAKALYRSLDSKGKEAIRKKIVSRALSKSLMEEGGKVVVNPTHFSNEMKKMATQFDIAFRGKDAQELIGLRKLLDETKHAQEAAVATKTGMQNFISGALGSAAATSALLGHWPVVLGALGAAGAGRVYESALVRDMMIRLAGTKPGTLPHEETLRNIVNALQVAAMRATSEER